MFKIRLVSAEYKRWLFIKKPKQKQAVAETVLFSEWAEYRLQSPLVVCVKLLKTASLGTHLDYRENRIKEVGVLGRVKACKCRSGVEAHTHKTGWVSGTF